MIKKLSLTILALIALSACAPAQAKTAGLQPMTFMAGFKPQANLPFVGAYVAKEKGYFTDEGLDVTIEHSAGGGEHLQLMAAGKVQVTTQDAAVLLKRRADPGLPFVSLALIGQKGQQAFVAMADSGINTPQDWAGRTIGFKGTPPPDLFAIMEAAGVDQDKVDLVNVGFDPRIFTEGKVDVYPVFKSNEPDTIRGWGYELNLWDAADFGVPTLGLAYVTTEEMIEKNPEMLQKFMNAVMHGLEFAQKNPEEAVDIVMIYAGEDANPAHMRYMLDTELADAQSAVTDEFGLGWQTQEQWQALHDMLVQHEAIAEPIDVAATFTTQFLGER